MNVSELAPAVEGRVRFSLSEQRLVPGDAGCYILSAHDGEVLYIGLTKSLSRRLGEHRANPEKTVVTEHGLAFWFSFRTCEVKGLENLERSWLGQYALVHGHLPPLNKVNSPVS